MKKEEVIASVRDSLDASGCQFSHDETNDQFSVILNVECALKEIDLNIGWADWGLAFSGRFPALVNLSRFEETLKYLNMINNVSAACFLTLDDRGIVECKHWISTYWLESLPKEALDDSFKTIASAFEIFSDGLLAIVSGASDAETEFKKAEAAMEEDNNEE